MRSANCIGITGMTGSNYKLSATFLGHSQDVKSVKANGEYLISGSRDATARAWKSPTDSRIFASGQGAFVNAVDTFVLDGVSYVLTAGADTLVSAWPIDADEPTHALVGHQLNVCCLATSPQKNLIFSGSWDKTVKIWKNWECIVTLEVHEQAVWDVLPVSETPDVPEGALTACADNFVRFFPRYNAKDVKHFKGHSQPVRALAMINQETFASGANDGSIRIWSISSGHLITQLNGHESFVYSLAYLPTTNELVSGGEDRSVRIWDCRSGDLRQTLTLPAISIWTVATLPNGDIACGSSDAAIRVFSREESRWAAMDVLAEYESTIANSTIDSTQVGDVKKSDLAGPEALFRPGSKEGQVIMVKLTDGSVEAHQWSVSAGTWTKIGTVVDAVGNSRKQLYNGQEYDFVFDVDVREGQPPLKLPYNVSQNPYEAAQKFLTANELPASYVDQVVQFIEKNTAGVQLGSAASSDPYTGANAYRSSQSGSQNATGTSSFPHRAFLDFPNINVPPIKNKIIQLNEQISASEPSRALSTKQIESLDQLFTTLQQTSGNNGVSLPTECLVTIHAMLSWPRAARFPALDLYRVICLVSPRTADDVKALLENLGHGDKDGMTNSMLALRGIANIFKSKGGSSNMKPLVSSIAAELIKQQQLLNKNGKVAAATILLNYSVLAVQRDLDKSSGSSLVDMCLAYLKEDDAEVLYRTLFAVGNLLLSPNAIASLSSNTVEKLRSAARIHSRHAEARVKSVAQEVQLLK